VTAAPPTAEAPAAVLVYGVVAPADTVASDGPAHPDGALPEGSLGPDGEPLRLVTHDDLAAVVGGVSPQWRPGRADLLAFSAVIDTLARRGPVVPVQFGSLMADEQEVVDQVLVADEDRLRDLLASLAGKTQVQVRARYVEEAVLSEVVAVDPEVRALWARTRELPEGAGHGDRVRLGERAARAVAERAAQDAETILGVVGRYAVDAISRPVAGMDVLDVAVLLEADQVAALEDALEALAQASYRRLRIRLVGPTAPYDFVGER